MQDILKGLTGDDVLDLLGTAWKTPTAYSKKGRAGLPSTPSSSSHARRQRERDGLLRQRCPKTILDDFNKMPFSKQSREHKHEEKPNGCFCPKDTIESQEPTIWTSQTFFPYYEVSNSTETFLNASAERKVVVINASNHKLLRSP